MKALHPLYTINMWSNVTAVEEEEDEDEVRLRCPKGRYRRSAKPNKASVLTRVFFRGRGKEMRIGIWVLLRFNSGAEADSWEFFGRWGVDRECTDCGSLRWRVILESSVEREGDIWVKSSRREEHKQRLYAFYRYTLHFSFLFRLDEQSDAFFELYYGWFQSVYWWRQIFNI
jgi:hypothetical protein